MTTYRFGPFQLHSESRRLMRETDEISLSDRHIEVLLQLVTRPGTIVTKDALIDAAWRDVAVTDNSLEQAISVLRRTLGDVEGQPFIETVPRRGYRFVASVSREAHRETDEGLAALLAPHRAWLEGRSLLETLERAMVAAAEAAFRRAHDALPDFAAPHIGLANALAFRFEASRSQETSDVDALAAAVQHAREACRLDPSLGESWATLGFVLSRAGDSEDALAASRRAVTLEPDNWRHQLRLAFVSWGEERLRAAGRARRLLPGLGLAHFLAASVHIARQAFDSARLEIETGISAEDAQPEGVRFGAVGLHWLEGLLQLQRGDEPGAHQSFERELAGRGAPHLYADECGANVHYARGVIGWRAGDPASAIDCFDRALDLAPGHVMARAARLVIRGAPSDPGDRRLAERIEYMRGHGRVIDAAVAEAIPRVLHGDDGAAAAHIERACAHAPSGAQGWSLPLDPLLAMHRRPDVWSGVMAALRTRAA